MNFFRSIAGYIFLIFYMIISWLFLLPIGYFVGKSNKEKGQRFAVKIINWGFSCLSALAAKVTVKGLENIPKDETVVFMGNHRGYFDVIITYQYLPFLTSIISKDALKKFPVVSNWMSRLGCLYLEKDNPKQNLGTILTAIDYIKNGTSMLIFPEGKRNLGEGVDTFQGGSFKLTQKTGARIVPFSITNTREVWERQFPWLSRQKVTLEFLPPISTAELTRDEQKELPEKVRVIVEESFRKNGGK